MSRVDYDFRTLDPHDTSAENLEALKAWSLSVSQGFHEGRPNEEALKVWIDSIREDEQRVVGAWLPEGTYGAGAHPVATFASYDKTINAGLGLVPLHMITDVTVSPAHRRRGLLTRMMVEDLASTDAPLAALTVSEGSIYGRFGFGVASFRRRIQVDTSARFAFKAYADAGRVEVVEPAQLWPLARDLFERFHATTRGSVDRPYFYGPILRNDIDLETGSPNPKVRGAVHLDAAGEPDGYATWKVVDADGETPATVQTNLLTLTDDAHRGLWQFLAGIDLTRRVIDRGSRTDDALDWAVTDPQVVDVKSVDDHIWIRVLDVPRALSERPWFADDEIVLGVDDPLGHAHDVFSITARDGRAAVEPSTAEPDVLLTAETLGSLYLGGVAVGTLARAGRLTGAPADVQRLAALMDGGPAPYSVTSF